MAYTEESTSVGHTAEGEAAYRDAVVRAAAGDQLSEKAINDACAGFPDADRGRFDMHVGQAKSRRDALDAIAADEQALNTGAVAESIAELRSSQAEIDELRATFDRELKALLAKLADKTASEAALAGPVRQRISAAWGIATRTFDDRLQERLRHLEQLAPSLRAEIQADERAVQTAPFKDAITSRIGQKRQELGFAETEIETIKQLERSPAAVELGLGPETTYAEVSET